MHSSNSRIVTRSDAQSFAIKALAAHYGGMAAWARAMKVDRKTVYNWQKAGKVPVEPTNYAMLCSVGAGLPLWFIRPDIYPWPSDGVAVHTAIGFFILQENER
jgi:hypothetical protein